VRKSSAPQSPLDRTTRTAHAIDRCEKRGTAVPLTATSGVDPDLFPAKQPFQILLSKILTALSKMNRRYFNRIS
jgi:hypothetical protein